MNKIIFDNHDSRIKYIDLVLERENLNGLPQFALPDGYRFVFYQDGDRDSWIQIEVSAKELRDFQQGVKVWNDYYGGHEDILPQRMVFIENAHGEKVATATAYFDNWGHDSPEIGYLHWVAVRRDAQGNGLARPLIAYTLNRLRELGYTHTKIHTQTTTWVACRLYLDFGFRPTAENAAKNRDGWRIMRALTNHPALEGFEAARMEEILDKTE